MNTKKKLRNTPYAHNPKLSNKYVIPFYFRFFFFNYLKLKKKKEKNKIVALLTHLKILYSKTDRDTLNLTANFLRVEPSLSCFIFFKYFFLFKIVESTPVHWLHFYFFTFIPHLHTTVINLLIIFVVVVIVVILRIYAFIIDNTIVYIV